MKQTYSIALVCILSMHVYSSENDTKKLRRSARIAAQKERKASQQETKASTPSLESDLSDTVLSTVTIGDLVKIAEAKKRLQESRLELLATLVTLREDELARLQVRQRHLQRECCSTLAF